MMTLGESSYLLEKCQVFSNSLLWELQQRYFTLMGVEAWRQTKVPHYITSNPTVANSYAEIVFACWRDQNQLTYSSEPLSICELGAGSGRFAFHFLKRLTRLCEQAGLAPTSFRYVLTDLAESNLDFWRRHPRFQTFFESGLLDIALFDINQSDQLNLQLSGETISSGSLKRPLVVVANYAFDSIPQELFYINAQQCHQCLVSLVLAEDPETLTVAELLERVQCHYDYRTLTESPYQEPHLTQLLADYQRALTDTYLLFPATGLRCLRRLKALSRQGMMVLSADKGDHTLAALQGKSAPALVRHGSFSLNVNLHAFKTFCEQTGGVTLFPDRECDHITVSCLLMSPAPASHVETQNAYQREVRDSGPDDFYTIIKHAREHLAEASVADILAYLRFSHYDSHQFGKYFLPRLLELAAGLSGDERGAVTDTVEKVWDSYFPLGEDLDLAYRIAGLFYEMNDYTRARHYFERSIEIYGQHTGTLFNLAACHQMAGQSEVAESLLRKVLKHDPGNEQAKELLAGAAPA
jgi:tetratricopeptide (TPR) repeat protein